MRLFLDEIRSPIGPLTIIGDEAERLRVLAFGSNHRAAARTIEAEGGASPSRGLPEAIRDAVAAYFNGNLAPLGSIAVEAVGTPFQKSVWAALRTIAPGETMSYGALAARIGKPLASRAVGLANGANPISIAVPCHRVIGANGSLTGFGGGLPAKRWLLAHEAAQSGLFAAARSPPSSGSPPRA